MMMHDKVSADRASSIARSVWLSVSTRVLINTNHCIPANIYVVHTIVTSFGTLLKQA
jgi:hypothetical protein